MTIPFLNLFQKAKTFLREQQSPETAARSRSAEKPTSERLSKTVMPNSTRNMAPRDFLDAASSGSTMRNAPSQSRLGLPPVVALALEPRVERTISLQLSDILPQIPNGYVKPVETFDADRRILLKASEIEKGMATGRPTVSLASVYEQAPEIFLRSVSASEPMQLPLPYAKVLDQFSGARVRADQQTDQDVPQVETPFLQVTIEDTERFGTTMEPLQASALPPVKVETASASALAAAEPEGTVRETGAFSARSTIPLSAPFSPAPEPPRVEPPTPTPSQPTRIPFHLPPNGAGASASESVPASSGPPVPTRPPARNPFKVSPPSDALRPKKTLIPGRERERVADESAVAPKPKTAPPENIKVAIPLQLILQSIPPFQLNGSPTNVPGDVRVEFPFSLIQPQLATGRIAIAPKTFQAAMPSQFRDMVIVDATETPVLLPLQEVLKNIPSAALQVREDQEQIEAGETIETPFSIKAREDAERFQAGLTPAAKPVELPPTTGPAAKIDKDKIDIQPAVASVAPPKPDKLDAKEVVTRARALPGVAGCSVTFADGLILAGSFPDEVAVEGLSAMAPPLLQRIEKHMLDSKLGALEAMTLHGEKSAVTFFMHGDICVTALHSVAELAAETQNQLSEMTKELSRTYAQPETHHVDH